jgi:hypothetical protein
MHIFPILNDASLDLKPETFPGGIENSIGNSCGNRVCARAWQLGRSSHAVAQKAYAGGLPKGLRRCLIGLAHCPACLEPVMDLRKGPGSRHNQPSAALRLLAATRYCLVAALAARALAGKPMPVHRRIACDPNSLWPPCIWPVPATPGLLPRSITGSNQKPLRLFCWACLTLGVS